MVYLVDGHTELTVLEMMKRDGKIKSAKSEVFCIAQKSPAQVDKIITLITKRKSKSITIITDTDSLNNESTKQKVLSNIDALSNNKFVKDISLIIQYNLEYEICKSLNYSQRHLLNIFNAEGVTELKSKIISENHNGLRTKLEGIYNSKFWSSEYHCITDDSFINRINNYIDKIMYI